VINIFILTHSENTSFKSDSLYSELVCENDTTGIMQTLSSYCSESEDEICGFLSQGFYFVRQGQPINEFFVENVLDSYDLIVPFEENVKDNLIIDFFKNEEEYSKQRSMFIDEIEQIAPELTEALKIANGCRSFIRPNCIIGRVGRLKELYATIEKSNCCKVNALWIGILTKAWVLHNNIRVRSLEIRNNDPEVWDIGYQKIDVVQKYIDVILRDYIEYRSREGFAEGFAQDNPYGGDFDGKIPIWMCWWQGESDMPDIIRACIESVKRNAPCNTEVRLITLENVSEYVTFTDVIIDKFNSGKISMTHLSDVLRAELLFRYGGMWIDATYYVPHKINEAFFDGKLFSIAFKMPLWGMDVMKGRWSSSLLAAAKGNVAVQFLLEGLWLYWDSSDEAVDYFFFDYILNAGYNHFDEIRKEIDAIRKSSNAVYDLQLKMNQRFSSEDLIWLNNAADFYKLNRRNEYIEKTIMEDSTFYSHILGTDSDAEVSKDMVIKCASYTEFIDNLRACNPYRILDLSRYLYGDGKISKGIVDEFLSETIVDTVCAGQNIGLGCIYDSIIDASEIVGAKIDRVIDQAEAGIYLVRLASYDEYDLIIVNR